MNTHLLQSLYRLRFRLLEDVESLERIIELVAAGKDTSNLEVEVLLDIEEEKRGPVINN